MHCLQFHKLIGRHSIVLKNNQTQTETKSPENNVAKTKNKTYPKENRGGKKGKT